MGRYSSGQRGRTVNPLITSSQVRILLSPRINTTKEKKHQVLLECFFSFVIFSKRSFAGWTKSIMIHVVFLKKQVLLECFFSFVVFSKRSFAGWTKSILIRVVFLKKQVLLECFFSFVIFSKRSFAGWTKSILIRVVF